MARGPGFRSSRRRRGGASSPFPFSARARRLDFLSGAGDLLIVRLDEGTVKSGQTSPFEIARYLRRGVEVHTDSRLHAKVFVFGKTVVVGSTNVSATSEGWLREAVVELSDPRAVSAASAFVHSLRGDVVTLNDAARLEKLYSPPKMPAGRGARSQPATLGKGQSVLWAVKLVSEGWDDEDFKQRDAGAPLARKKLRNSKHFVVDEFCWNQKGFGAHVRVGQRVLQVVEERDDRVFVDAPYRIVRLQRYRSNGSARVMVFVEEEELSRVFLGSDCSRSLARWARG